MARCEIWEPSSGWACCSGFYWALAIKMAANAAGCPSALVAELVFKSPSGVPAGLKTSGGGDYNLL